MTRAMALVLLAVGPALPSAVAPIDGPPGLAAEGVVVAMLGAARPRLAGALWAALVTYALMLAGSRVATHDELPLYDLLLLLRPLVVVGADLYGPAAYAAAALALLAPLPIAAAGVAACRHARPPHPAAWALLLLAALPGGRSLTVDVAADLGRSASLASAFAAERAARPHHDLEALPAAADVDVLVYVVESYGEVASEISSAWRHTLEGLDRDLRADGWVTAAGWSEAPVRGGRSWISDASVLTGLHLDSQANFERVSAAAHRMPTLPSWFAARGHRTVLVRPSDRERPGVRHHDPFRFQHTLFFDDIGYTGPTFGWGHIPDQYSLHVAHQRLIDGQPQPTFAFFHLATSHLPWTGAPPLLEDPRALQTLDGDRTPIAVQRSPWEELVNQLRRFRAGDHEPTVDRSEQADHYVEVVLYDLRAIVKQLGAPAARPRLILIYGDHQPAFLARGRSARVPVHVMTDDTRRLQPFLDAGFTPGWVPRRGAIEHRDLFPLIARAAAE